MTQITADQYRQRLDAIAATPAMQHDNVHLPQAGTALTSRLMLGIGAVLLLITIVGGFIYSPRHALASYQVGVMSVTAISLGGLFWTMVFHLVAAGWSVTVRRIFEQLMAMLPWCVALLLPIVVLEIAAGGILLTWLGIDPQTNYLLAKKEPFLNPPFFVIRFLLYASVWVLLANRLFGFSIEQDATGDRFLSNKARTTSSWGMLLFALFTAFFAFDFMMAMDYRFFSTMWGVYYATSAFFGSVAVVILVLLASKSVGRLTGAVGKEHVHDLGKLLFAFGAPFWAYIAFSQYFLIWYSNIPEETAWFIHRQANGWENLGALLVVGHFVIPFLILLFRPVKRALPALAVLAAWLLLMLFLDMVYIIRPMVYIKEYADQNPGFAAIWLDFAGALGVLGVWAGIFVARLGKYPLVPLKDPRLGEALHHKNYV